MKLSVLLLLSLFAGHVHASTCSGIDRALSDERKAQLAPVVARQLHIASGTILQSFRYRGWSILYVDTQVSDESFLFYRADPLRSTYLTLWAGGAMRSEGPQIRRWVLKNAPGIPSRLASCFAWHVTKDRDM